MSASAAVPTVKLHVAEGPHAGTAFTLREHSTFIVGRAPESHFCLPEKDPYVSRFHFMIEANPPLCKISDMRSRNGTRVNGDAVETVLLRHGDRIKVGMTTFLVELSALFSETLDAPSSQAPELDDDALCDQQRRDWRLGSRRRVEDYLAAAPDLRDRPETLLDLIAGEVALRREAGERPQLAEYRERFPALADVLEFALEADLSQPPNPSPTHSPSPSLPTIPGYRILEPVGRGGMGVVYRAERLADGMQVAVKTILPATVPDRVTIRRFLREADILKTLQHPHIVGFGEMGETQGLLYFAMDFVPGIDGSRWRKAHSNVEWPRVARLGVQMTEALAFAHDRGFVHRDVKPGNVLIEGASPAESLRVADFGLARTYQSTSMSGLTLDGFAAGSPPYMSPEQILDFRSVKPASDQYGAAATLYFLLAGVPPFGSGVPTHELFRRILERDPIPLLAARPDVPAEFAALVHRAMHRDPKRRFESTLVFRDALSRFR